MDPNPQNFRLRRYKNPLKTPTKSKKSQQFRACGGLYPVPQACVGSKELQSDSYIGKWTLAAIF